MTKTRNAAEVIALVLLGFIIGIAISVCAQSKAQLRLELSAGSSTFHTRENQTWYDDRYETNNSLKDHSLQVGVSGSLYKEGTWDFRARGAYVDLGRFSGNNTAPAWDGEIITTCNLQTGHNCSSNNNGNGGAYGWTAGPVVEKSFGDWAVGAETGVAYLRTWYNVIIERKDCAWAGGCNGSFQKDDATGWIRTWYVGTSIAYKGVFAAVRLYENLYEQGQGPRGDVGLTGHRARTIQLGYQVTL